MNTLRRTLLLLMLPALFFAADFGGLYTSTMMASGQMSHCPYTGVTSFCHNDPVGHFITWQKLFSPALPQAPTLMLIALFAIVALFVLATDFFIPTNDRQPLFSRWREAALFDPLQLAFARGRIHSKAF